jgi:hypothetical protein
MTSPLPLPEWFPWWVQLAILIAALLFGLMFLLMPFAVFGVKGRLDMLEARLDEIQGEIRSLALRLPEPDPDDALAMPGRTHFGGQGGHAGSSRHADPDYDDYGSQRPPIPPAPQDRGLPPGPPRARARTEPRLY